jgi:peroxiredoxin
MTRRHQWLLAGAIAVVVAVGVVAASRIVGLESPAVGAGSRAPDFRAVTLGKPSVARTLADYRGNVVLLNIWRTDCAPCVVEMPTMEELHNEFHDRGLRIVAVSVDPPGSEEKVRRFAENLGLTFEILYDSEDAISGIYGATGYPETFVIARNGIITRKVYQQDWSSLPNRSLVAQLLGEDAPPSTQEPPPPAIGSGG